MDSTPAPWPHHRHVTEAIERSSTVSSSTRTSPPKEKWWNALVVVVARTSILVRLPHDAHR
jgi:hypothetical protein